jgi:hypothetical protein
MTLQYKWDVWMLTCFFTKQDITCGQAFVMFCEKNKIEFSCAKELKRTPSAFVSKKTIRVFCLSYLGEKFRNYLWTKTIDEIFDIAAELQTSNVQFCAKSSVISKSDKICLKNTNKAFNLAMKALTIRSNDNEKHGGSAWNTCK